MGITYEVDASKGVVFERWLGAIAGPDIVDHWMLLATDKEAMACGRSVADIRECALQVSGEELRYLVTFVLGPVLEGRHWKTAVLVREPVQFGMAREYQTLAGVFKEDAVFTDLPAACQWVAS
jgi:hypothetical protein